MPAHVKTGSRHRANKCRSLPNAPRLGKELRTPRPLQHRENGQGIACCHSPLKCGPSLNPSDCQSAYASDLLYLIVLGLSKCCTSLLYQHLTTHAARWIPRSLLGVSIIWTIVSIILIGIRCSRTQPWTDINDKCRSLVSAFIIPSHLIPSPTPESLKSEPPQA